MTVVIVLWRVKSENHVSGKFVQDSQVLRSIFDVLQENGVFRRRCKFELEIDYEGMNITGIVNLTRGLDT